MKQSERVGNARNKGPRRKTIIADVDNAAASQAKSLGNAVGLIESESKLARGDTQADMPQETQRRHAVMRDFVDVEGEFGLYVLVLPLRIVHR